MIRVFDGSLTDAQGLLAVEQATFDDCPYSAQQLQAILSSGSQRTWLAVEEGRIVGFAIAFPVSSVKGVWWEIDLLAVHPASEGRGLGRQLIRAACAGGEGVARQARAVVAADNSRSARAFARAGFRPHGPACTLLICRLDEIGRRSPPARDIAVYEVRDVAELSDWLYTVPASEPYGPNLTLLSAEHNGQRGGYAELIEVQTILYRGLWIESLSAPAKVVREALVYHALERARTAGLDEVSAMVPARNLPLQNTLLSAGARSLGTYRWFVAALPLPRETGRELG